MVRMSQTFTMDSRIPVGANVSEDDPNHPKNVTKLALMTSAQANADTKYDIYPPPRVDGFQDYRTTKHREAITTVAAIIAVVVLIAFALQARILPLKIALVLAIVFCIHYIAGKFEKRTVYNIESREAI